MLALGGQTGTVPVVVVPDASDPHLDEVRLLRSPDGVLRRLGVVVVEGVTIVERLLRQQRPVRRLVVTPTLWARLRPLLDDSEVTVVLVEREVLAEAAGFDVHRGVLAFVDEPAPAALATLMREARTLVVVEGLNDAENLGALMRSSWALGADALVLDPTTLDPYGRRVVRVSMGAALDLPIARAESWPDVLTRLRDEGVVIMALTPHAEAVPLRSLEIEPERRVAVLVGAEGPGLSEAALRSANVTVRIPMRPGVDSLNVTHAAAIALAALDRPPTITS